ncbi:MAG: AAA family ATPase [SAR202 cluster bacterium]|nr:AAA family ATPase [SAR202 cluster bacterium]MQG26667.1 AAA family ATPase [SAR202 cluster bacterium]
MESLGDILKRLTITSTLTSTDASELGTPEEINCAICQDIGWVSKQLPFGHPDFGAAFQCSCQESKNSNSRLATLQTLSNLGPLSSITFESTSAEYLNSAQNPEMFQKALAEAIAYGNDPTGWIVFTGPHNSGKTLLAACLANEAIQKDLMTYFVSVSELLDHLRGAFAPDTDSQYDSLFEQIKSVPFLVLDDLNTNSSTPWAHEKLLQILNHRFNYKLPTVFTIRDPFDALDESISSKLQTNGEFSKLIEVGSKSLLTNSSLGRVPSQMSSRMTFDKFDPAGNSNSNREQQNALIQTLNGCTTFAENPEGWILLTGPNGSGKTHLAISVANELEKKNIDVYYAFVPNLLDYLRASFSPTSSVNFDSVFESLKESEVLILDDLGGESSTPWAEEKLYQIIVHRHELRMPTIITSSLSLDELERSKPRIASRLVDGMVVDWLPIISPNYRDQRRIN